MKRHQFEEITAALSIIIALLAYKFEIYWLFYIYLFKSALDTYAAIKEAYISVKNKNKKNETSI